MSPGLTGQMQRRLPHTHRIAMRIMDASNLNMLEDQPEPAVDQRLFDLDD